MEPIVHRLERGGGGKHEQKMFSPFKNNKYTKIHYSYNM